MYDIIKSKFVDIIKGRRLESEEVRVYARALSPQEAIGNPEEDDYPLVKGREHLMQAEFKGSLGQAFTDMYGNFSGRLGDILEMDLKNNFRRAIFISTLNAAMRHLGLVDKTIHCKDEEPRECARELVKWVTEKYGNPKIAFIGLQPRMVEELAKNFELKVADMDEDNIDREKYGLKIWGPEKTEEFLRWCDIVLATGTTVVNNSIGQFRISKPVIYYGITISGVAKLLGLKHFCYCGH